MCQYRFESCTKQKIFSRGGFTLHKRTDNEMSYKRLKPIREQDEDDEVAAQNRDVTYVQKMLWKFEDSALLATSPNLKPQRISRSLPSSPDVKDGKFFNEILRTEGSDNLLLLEELER